MRRSIPLVLVALLCLSVIVPGSAVASPLADLGDSTEDAGLIERAQNTASALVAGAQGLYERTLHWATSAVSGEDPDPEQQATDTREVFNAHNESLRTYINDRNASDSAYQVIEIEFVHEDASSSIFVVADYNATTGEYDALEAVEATDRNVDESVTLEGYAAANASAEFEHFVEAFVEPDEDVGDAYKAELAAKYARNVETSFPI